jgi:hypothetical protein
MPFITVPKQMEYLDINLTIHVWNWYAENYNSRQEIQKYLSKCRDIPCSWIGILSAVKMSILFGGGGGC